jgi:hypothetical protein
MGSQKKGEAMNIASKIVLVAAAPLLLLTEIALSTPAAAIGADAAISACKKRPPGICWVDVSNDFSVYIWVCNPGQGCRTIFCPAVGACSFVGFRTPNGGKATVGAARSVTRVLSGS